MENQNLKNTHNSSSAAGHANVAHFTTKKRDGNTEKLELEKIKSSIARAAVGIDGIDTELVEKEIIKNIYDGLTTTDIQKALVMGAVPFIELDPGYSILATRLLLQKICKEVMGKSVNEKTFLEEYKRAFVTSIEQGIENKILNKDLLKFDLVELANYLVTQRDSLFEYMGLQTLYERYFFKIGEKKVELPQAFWMRVAMGLAINEKDPNFYAKKFYDVISTLRYIPSTPTLFHSGLKLSQLSSCFLTTVKDDLHHIFKCLGDNAQLAKFSGGVGTDWTNLRGTGAKIKSINISSQGLIPFLKISNDATVAISRSGRKRGAITAYLEVWHYDFEDFLDLKRNTGDERRRTHDINTASWIPDLFMKRVEADGEWMLFSPDETPDLHDAYGKKFEELYCKYEEKARNGEIELYKILSASQLWKKMITRLFETGHPWITFKDPCNIRSPQDHCGVVHSSNLCTEITLNTSQDETAVCNLGSINLEKHVIDGVLNKELLTQTIETAIRMLDNTVEANFYPIKEAANSNILHRPLGLGLMGLQDAMYKLDINFDDPQALKFSDETMEFVSYNAIMSSSKLAKERGTYASYNGSKWDRGILPIDTIDLLEKERGIPTNVSKSSSLDWTPVKEHIKQWGMRNSNLMAIAPTATISNISGCFPCIEPIYKNIYVKSNIHGEFTVVNHYLVDDLKKLGLWNQEMLNQLKFNDGSVQNIQSIPEDLKKKYKEAFEIDPEWLLQLSAARGKWIDQSQSHNIFIKGVSGKKLSHVYFAAWKLGLKTTYYLRTLGASQIEKSTLDASYGFTQKRNGVAQENVAACKIENPECESCQ